MLPYSLLPPLPSHPQCTSPQSPVGAGCLPVAGACLSCTAPAPVGPPPQSGAPGPPIHTALPSWPAGVLQPLQQPEGSVSGRDKSRASCRVHCWPIAPRAPKTRRPSFCPLYSDWKDHGLIYRISNEFRRLGYPKRFTDCEKSAQVAPSTGFVHYYLDWRTKSNHSRAQRLPSP